MNKCYISSQTSTTYAEFLATHLEEWILFKYILYAVAGVLVLFLIILAFVIVPLSHLLFFYLSALFIFIYEKTHKLPGAYHSKTWDGARLILLTLWDGFARFWHGKKVWTAWCEDLNKAQDGLCLWDLIV